MSLFVCLFCLVYFGFLGGFLTHRHLMSDSKSFLQILLIFFIKNDSKAGIYWS